MQELVGQRGEGAYFWDNHIMYWMSPTGEEAKDYTCYLTQVQLTSLCYPIPSIHFWKFVWMIEEPSHAYYTVTMCTVTATLLPCLSKHVPYTAYNVDSLYNQYPFG